MFFNYKHSHSVVLMAIYDAKYVIRFVDIGAHGRRSDGGIFKSSSIGKAFDEGRMNIPQPAAIREEEPILPYCLVGDEAFPLKPYLLRPYPGRGGLTPEQIQLLSESCEKNNRKYVWHIGQSVENL